jgi:epoxyqueuosine reductase
MNATAVQSLSLAALAAEVKRRARELGFDLVGIAPADPTPRRDYIRQWIDEGRGGSMEYLARRFEERADPAVYLPGARSVVCVALNYYAALEPPPEVERAFHGRVARYALGDDYHEVIKTRLHALADWMREAAPQAQTRACVDTAPVLERELAARAGVGWVGKHTGVLNAHAGSWLLLGEIVTTLALPPDEPATDHCGTCTRCIDACPTGAIIAPYQLDASRCISYLTIEHRGEIPAELHAPIGDWLYGCDVCQDVCPHNRHAPTTEDPALQPRFPTGSLDVREVVQWTDEDYRARLKGSAMKRVKLPLLKRNAGIVASNHARGTDSKSEPGENAIAKTPRTPR